MGEERAAAYVALGSNVADAPVRLARALVALTRAGERVVAVADAVWSPYEAPAGQAAVPDVPPVLDTVAEIRTGRDPETLLALLHRIEDAEGRTRVDPGVRTLDLDLLGHGATVRDPPSPPPRLPHPRALERAFVLAPWAAIAPLAVVPGTDEPVVVHAARLRARRPEAFAALVPHGPVDLPDLASDLVVLEDRRALGAWRAAGAGTVGVVPTMGALHRGHESLLRRARGTCDRVLATLFVNPLQFGPGEDLARYPRTFDADCALLRHAGADAVYAPTPGDLYPPDFSTSVTPGGPALGFEGDVRPGHFAGVATVVLKLWLRTRPDRLFLGRKDAQQLAVLRRMARDLDLDGQVVACPTVHEKDGLALSSRNRYLSVTEREQARALPAALASMAGSAAAGSGGLEDWTADARRRLADAGLGVDYVEIVDPDTFERVETLRRPALAVAAVRAGTTRLLDNTWIVAGRKGLPFA